MITSLPTCVLGNIPLDCSLPYRTYLCKLKVINTEFGTYVGIGNRQKLVADNYEFGRDYDMIRNDGQINTPSNELTNFKMSPVRFDTGDVVELEFQTSAMQLHIRCKGFEQCLLVKQSEDELRFIVFMTAISEAMEVVE